MLMGMIGANVSLSLDAATTAWVNAVVAAGGAVSSTQQTRVNTLILALKGHSLFSANSRLWLHAGESDAKQATIDVMNLSVATPVNTPTLAAGGYTGNGTTSYVDLGTRPSNYAQNSGSFGCASLTSSTTADNSVTIGASDSANCFADLLPLQSGANGLARVNRQGAGSVAGTGSTNRKGLYVVTSTGATAQAFYKNGSSTALGTNAVDPSQVLTLLPNFFICGRSDLGTASSFSVDQIAASFILAGVTGANAALLMGDINAYLTAWGVAAY